MSDESAFDHLGLLDRQFLFMQLFPRLIDYIHSEGYQCTEGDGLRDERVFGKLGEKKGYGHSKSLHKLKLAHDVNLFKDRKFLTRTEDHRPIGEWWENLHPLCQWGGHFDDGNHYSIKYGGMR